MMGLDRIEKFPESYERLKLACTAAEIIAKSMNPDKIILFGSTVRFEANKESDVDIAVITSHDRAKDPSFIRRDAEISQLMMASGIKNGSRPMGTHITFWWNHEYKGARQLIGSSEDFTPANDALFSVITEGVTLYQSLRLDARD